MQTAAAVPSTQTLPRDLSRSLLRRASLLNADFDLHSKVSGERPLIERYIAEQFRTSYGASIGEFMPLLLTMHNQGQLSAVAGIRSAKHQTLFLDQYFSEPVEQIIEDVTGQVVDGMPIIEIGNLAGTHRGSSQLLFIVLTGILHQAGFEWITFTATPFVEKSLRCLGFESYILGPARPDSMGSTELSEWGSYYDCDPKVIVGRASSAARALNNSKSMAAFLSSYRDRISTLALALHNSPSNGQSSFTA